MALLLRYLSYLSCLGASIFTACAFIPLSTVLVTQTRSQLLYERPHLCSVCIPSDRVSAGFVPVAELFYVLY